MPGKWHTVATVDTPEGRLELKQRAPSAFLITIDGRVLMNSVQQRSEQALAALSCRELDARAAVLIGGLGMGFTLRAALDKLSTAATVTVAEITAAVVEWCRGPLANLSAHALSDPRVTVTITDVAAVIKSNEACYDAIIIDLYEGPHAATQNQRDPFYSAAAIARAKRALRPAGIFAVWSEDRDLAFEQRLAAAGFRTQIERPGRGGRRHAVYLARRV